MKRWRDANIEEHRPKAAAQMRKWRQTEAGKRAIKGYLLKRNYGLSIEDFERMAEAQKGACAICKTQLDLGFFTAVDHDHETGAVRGLLCSKCNMALGGFKDSIGLLDAAAAYLRKYGG